MSFKFVGDIGIQLATVLALEPILNGVARCFQSVLDIDPIFEFADWMPIRDSSEINGIGIHLVWVRRVLLACDFTIRAVWAAR